MFKALKELIRLGIQQIPKGDQEVVQTWHLLWKRQHIWHRSSPIIAQQISQTDWLSNSNVNRCCFRHVWQFGYIWTLLLLWALKSHQSCLCLQSASYVVLSPAKYLQLDACTCIIDHVLNLMHEYVYPCHMVQQRLSALSHLCIFF